MVLHETHLRLLLRAREMVDSWTYRAPRLLFWVLLLPLL